MSHEIVRSGEQSIYDSGEFITLQEEMSLDGLKPRDWLRFEISAYVRDGERVSQRDHCAELVVELFDDKQRRKEWAGAKITIYIGNTGNSIWSIGEVNMWDTASFYVRIPRNAKSGWTMKVFVWNPHGQKMFLDDFKISYYRQ
jgi:hypothetical protein